MLRCGCGKSDEDREAKIRCLRVDLNSDGRRTKVVKRRQIDGLDVAELRKSIQQVPDHRRIRNVRTRGIRLALGQDERRVNERRVLAVTVDRTESAHVIDANANGPRRQAQVW